MNTITKLVAALGTIVGFGLSAQQAQAANTCADTTVLELGVDNTSSPATIPAEFDITLKVKRVDNGSELFVYARHFMHNHTGVQRIERLGSQAFLSGNKVHLCWDSSSSNITKAFLKK